MATQGAQAPARGNTFFKDRKLDAPVSGIDSAGLIVMVIMRVITFFETPHLLATPGAPEHPQRDGDDDRGRSELEVRLCRFGIQVLAQIQDRKSTRLNSSHSQIS